jgi:hypothetical protein
LNDSQVTRLDATKAALSPATGSRTAGTKGKGSGTGLMVQVPTDTLRALRMKAAADGSTVRALVLKALHAAGYPVPQDEVVDRRRKT